MKITIEDLLNVAYVVREMDFDLVKTHKIGLSTGEDYETWDDAQTVIDWCHNEMEADRGRKGVTFKGKLVTGYAIFCEEENEIE